jgi:hypothetical protein
MEWVEPVGKIKLMMGKIRKIIEVTARCCPGGRNIHSRKKTYSTGLKTG